MSEAKASDDANAKSIDAARNFRRMDMGPVKMKGDACAFITEDVLATLIDPHNLNNSGLQDIYAQRDGDFEEPETIEVQYMQNGKKHTEILFVDTYLQHERPRICVSVNAVHSMHRCIAVLTRKLDNALITLRSCRRGYLKELIHLRELLDRQDRGLSVNHDAYFFNMIEYQDEITVEQFNNRMKQATEELEQKLLQKQALVSKLQQALFRRQGNIDVTDTAEYHEMEQAVQELRDELSQLTEEHVELQERAAKAEKRVASLEEELEKTTKNLNRQLERQSTALKKAEDSHGVLERQLRRERAAMFDKDREWRSQVETAKAAQYAAEQRAADANVKLIEQSIRLKCLEEAQEDMLEAREGREDKAARSPRKAIKLDRSGPAFSAEEALAIVSAAAAANGTAHGAPDADDDRDDREAQEENFEGDDAAFAESSKHRRKKSRADKSRRKKGQAESTAATKASWESAGLDDVDSVLSRAAAVKRSKVTILDGTAEIDSGSDAEAKEEKKKAKKQAKEAKKQERARRRAEKRAKEKRRDSARRDSRDRGKRDKEKRKESTDTQAEEKTSPTEEAEEHKDNEEGGSKEDIRGERIRRSSRDEKEEGGKATSRQSREDDENKEQRAQRGNRESERSNQEPEEEQEERRAERKTRDGDREKTRSRRHASSRRLESEDDERRSERSRRERDGDKDVRRNGEHLENSDALKGETSLRDDEKADALRPGSIPQDAQKAEALNAEKTAQSDEKASALAAGKSVRGDERADANKERIKVRDSDKADALKEGNKVRDEVSADALKGGKAVRAGEQDTRNEDKQHQRQTETATVENAETEPPSVQKAQPVNDKPAAPLRRRNLVPATDLPLPAPHVPAAEPPVRRAAHEANVNAEGRAPPQDTGDEQMTQDGFLARSDANTEQQALVASEVEAQQKHARDVNEPPEVPSEVASYARIASTSSRASDAGVAQDARADAKEGDEGVYGEMPETYRASDTGTPAGVAGNVVIEVSAVDDDDSSKDAGRSGEDGREEHGLTSRGLESFEHAPPPGAARLEDRGPSPPDNFAPSRGSPRTWSQTSSNRSSSLATQFPRDRVSQSNLSVARLGRGRSSRESRSSSKRAGSRLPSQGAASRQSSKAPSSVHSSSRQSSKATSSVRSSRASGRATSRSQDSRHSSRPSDSGSSYTSRTSSSGTSFTTSSEDGSSSDDDSEYGLHRGRRRSRWFSTLDLRAHIDAISKEGEEACSTAVRELSFHLSEENLLALQVQIAAERGLSAPGRSQLSTASTADPQDDRVSTAPSTAPFSSLHLPVPGGSRASSRSNTKGSTATDSQDESSDRVVSRRARDKARTSGDEYVKSPLSDSLSINALNWRRASFQFANRTSSWQSLPAPDNNVDADADRPAASPLLADTDRPAASPLPKSPRNGLVLGRTSRRAVSDSQNRSSLLVEGEGQGIPVSSPAPSFHGGVGEDRAADAASRQSSPRSGGATPRSGAASPSDLGGADVSRRSTRLPRRTFIGAGISSQWEKLVPTADASTQTVISVNEDISGESSSGTRFEILWDADGEGTGPSEAREHEALLTLVMDELAALCRDINAMTGGFISPSVRDDLSARFGQPSESQGSPRSTLESMLGIPAHLASALSQISGAYVPKRSMGAANSIVRPGTKRAGAQLTDLPLEPRPPQHAKQSVKRLTRLRQINTYPMADGPFGVQFDPDGDDGSPISFKVSHAPKRKLLERRSLAVQPALSDLMVTTNQGKTSRRHPLLPGVEENTEAGDDASKEFEDPAQDEKNLGGQHGSSMATLTTTASISSLTMDSDNLGALGQSTLGGSGQRSFLLHVGNRRRAKKADKQARRLSLLTGDLAADPESLAGGISAEGLGAGLPSMQGLAGSRRGSVFKGQVLKTSIIHGDGEELPGNVWRGADTWYDDDEFDATDTPPDADGLIAQSRKYLNAENRKHRVEPLPPRDPAHDRARGPPKSEQPLPPPEGAERQEGWFPRRSQSIVSAVSGAMKNMTHRPTVSALLRVSPRG